jgi:ABC-type transporter Mla subunit MlaD
MRKVALVFIVALVAVILWLPLRKPATHRISLTTYFRSGEGLQSKAAVRVDGVELGSVTSVRVRPELGERPVEVVMEVATPYDLPIPSDSTARLSTQGLLGPTIVDIDTRRTQGARIGNNGVLKTAEMTDEQMSQVMKHAVEVKTKPNKKAGAPSKPTDPAAR